MTGRKLKALVEALIFVAEKPLSVAGLSNAIDDNVSREEIRRAIKILVEEYRKKERGIEIVEVAKGYQMRTLPEFAPWVKRVLNVRAARLSRAAMETMAMIAYRQPLTRGELEAIRGVDCGGVLKTLLDKRLIKIADRKEVPGRPCVYATTNEFLEVFGLKNLSYLPRLKEVGTT